jgi:hypothetical protein
VRSVRWNYRWTSWIIIGRDPDGSEWIASRGYNLRSEALTQMREEFVPQFPLAKFVTRAVTNVVELALPRKEPTNAR